MQPRDRSVLEFVREIWVETDVEDLKIKWDLLAGTGMYLEDVSTGNTYRLGWINRWKMLAPAQQEAICRGLNRPDWLVLLGLANPD
jgi:hypothetical protein